MPSVIMEDLIESGQAAGRIFAVGGMQYIGLQVVRKGLKAVQFWPAGSKTIIIPRSACMDGRDNTKSWLRAHPTRLKTLLQRHQALRRLYQPDDQAPAPANIPGSKQSPVSRVFCASCNGQGSTVCSKCNGGRQNGGGKPCLVCNGDSKILCDQCHGTGSIPVVHTATTSL